MSSPRPLPPELEKLLFQQSKLANLGECVAQLAHELNNPLAIITSKVEDMLRRLQKDGIEPARLEQDLRKVLETTGRITKVSKTFLHFSRQTAETDPPMAFSVRQAVDDSLQLCNHRLQLNQVDLKSNIDPSFEIQGRPWEISQILVNLILNSADAIVDHSPRWIEVTAEEKSSKVQIIVTDSGAGIPTHLRSEIMKPFFTTKKAGLGSGIGLSLSQKLAQSNGGQLFLNESSILAGAKTGVQRMHSLPHLLKEVYNSDDSTEFKSRSIYVEMKHICPLYKVGESRPAGFILSTKAEHNSTGTLSDNVGFI